MNFYRKDTREKLERYLGVKKNPWEYEIELWEKVSKHNNYFARVPWILWIAVCNSLAMNTAHETSDIDLFIITRRNRLWIARIMMTLLLTITRERKTSSSHAWKFCLSFFITEDHLDFKDIAIKNDIYLAYWINTLKPIINRKNIFEEFRNNNLFLLDWTASWKALHNWNNKNKKLQKKLIQQLLKTPKLLTYCWDICEKLLKSIFLPRTKKSFQKLWKPFWVVIADNILKFHDKDKRKEIRDVIFEN